MWLRTPAKGKSEVGAELTLSFTLVTIAPDMTTK